MIKPQPHSDYIHEPLSPEDQDVLDKANAVVIACPICTVQLFGKSDLADHYHDVHKKDEMEQDDE